MSFYNNPSTSRSPRADFPLPQHSTHVHVHASRSAFHVRPMSTILFLRKKHHQNNISTTRNPAANLGARDLVADQRERHTQYQISKVAAVPRRGERQTHPTQATQALVVYRQLVPTPTPSPTAPIRHTSFVIRLSSLVSHLPSRPFADLPICPRLTNPLTCVTIAATKRIARKTFIKRGRGTGPAKPRQPVRPLDGTHPTQHRTRCQVRQHPLGC
jgi:hypothetical protein